MQQHESLSDASAVRTLGGYLASVSVGTLVFVILATSSRIRGFESAMGDTFGVKVSHLVIVTSVMFAIAWIVAIVATALPCAALTWIVRKNGVSHWLFYVLTGMVFGVLATLVCGGLFDHWYGDLQGEGLFTAAKFFVPAGAVAGTVFWSLAGRHY